METIGSLIDKLSINELKIYHMKEQRNRAGAEDMFISECEERLAILNMQRDDLKEELQAFMDDIISGKRKLRLYRQLKMYNEKKYKD